MKIIADVPETVVNGKLEVVEELRRHKARRIHFERQLFFRNQIAMTNQIEARLEKMFAVNKVDCELVIPGIRHLVLEIFTFLSTFYVILCHIFVILTP